MQDGGGRRAGLQSTLLSARATSSAGSPMPTNNAKQNVHSPLSNKPLSMCADDSDGHRPHSCTPEQKITRRSSSNILQETTSLGLSTYELVALWLLGSWRTASSLSSSSLFRRVVGTDRDGIWLSSNPYRCWNTPVVPGGGEVKSDPERAGRLNMAAGEVKLEVE